MRCSSSYDSKYDYFIRRQNYLRKVLRMHHLRKSICHKRLRSTRTLRHMRKMETSADQLCGDCSDGACSDDITLSDVPSTGMTMTPIFNEPIVMLQRDRVFFVVKTPYDIS